ncbi:MAG: Kae1-associated serine/threonine protein kinase [Candidatus Diapherotrites archaeon]|nr:Kae1-associated serine/threonine protein kinase [Candidatus Diapherotrites archaeon]
MEVVKRGAEAIIYADGERIIKVRMKKGYRHPELDRRLRLSRTRREARLLKKVREMGVPAPKVMEVDEENFRIVMERIRGPTLKSVLLKEKRSDLMERLGELVATLHRNNVIHGDLTTSNVIVSGDLYLIDFGLGEVSHRVEDKAVDLVCFEKSYTATHPDFPEGWEAFIESYRRNYPGAEKVLRQMEAVKRRARYL